MCSSVSREVFVAWQNTRTGAFPADWRRWQADHCCSHRLSVLLMLCFVSLSYSCSPCTPATEPSHFSFSLSLSLLVLSSFKRSTCWPCWGCYCHHFHFRGRKPSGTEHHLTPPHPPSAPNLSWPGLNWAHCKVLWIKQKHFVIVVIVVHQLAHAHKVLNAIVFPVHMETEAGPKNARADFGLPHSTPDSRTENTVSV